MAKKINRRIWLILFSGIIFFAACDKLHINSRPYVARVNGAKIYLDEYQRRLAQKKSLLPKEYFSDQDSRTQRLEEEVLDNLITEKIMYLRAEELGLTVGPEELDKRIGEIKKDYGESFSRMFAESKQSLEQWKEDLKKEMLFEKLVAVDVNVHVQVSEEEAKDYFNKNSDKYIAQPKVRVAQIVVRDAATAREALRQLKAGADFSAVAREKSIGPEAGRGGDLGFITREVMPEPLDKAIFALYPNRISPVVKSQYGFHILKVLEVSPAKVKNFAESKQEVMADVRAMKEEAAFGRWLAALKAKAVIKKKYAVLRKNAQTGKSGNTVEKKQ